MMQFAPYEGQQKMILFSKLCIKYWKQQVKHAIDLLNTGW